MSVYFVICEVLNQDLAIKIKKTAFPLAPHLVSALELGAEELLRDYLSHLHHLGSVLKNADLSVCFSRDMSAALCSPVCAHMSVRMGAELRRARY